MRPGCALNRAVPIGNNLTLPDQSGFVAGSSGPTIVSIHRIQDSTERRFSNANMLMGRALADVTASISRVTAVPMEIWTSGGRLLRVDLPAERLSVRRELVAGW